MMTQLTCPQCSTRIPASNINVQEKIAVCPACDTVFRFDTPEATPVKAKHRKVKQPANLTLRDDDEKLEMAFRTNFRLGQNEDFIIAIMAIVFLAFLSYVFLLPDEKLLATRLFVFPVAGLILAIYRLGLLLFNRTQITADEHAIRVARKPLPNPLATDQEVLVSNIAHIRCEETDASKREKYDTPRYRVFAEMVDGHEKLIVNDVVEDYGYFIAAQLQEFVANQHGEAEEVGEALRDETDSEIASSNPEAAYRLRESEHRLSGTTFSKQ
jgi:hypothetical protein